MNGSPAAPATRQSGRRQELLDVAAQVFAEKGVAHTTVRDIAERAGILSGSLYHHFQSKDQMVAEILERGLGESAERDAAIIAGANDLASALDQLVYNLVLWVGREPEVARILSNDQQYINDTPALAGVDAHRQVIRRLWIDLVREGGAAGVFEPSGDPEVAVRAIFDGALASVRWLPPVGTTDPADIGRQLATFYLRGLLAPPS